MRSLKLLLRAYKCHLSGIGVCTLTGWLLLESFAFRAMSFDLLAAARCRLSPLRSKETAIVYTDSAGMTTAEAYEQLLSKLRKGGAKTVSFDVIFTNDFWRVPEKFAVFSNAVYRAVTETSMKIVFAAEGVIRDGQNKEIEGPNWLEDLAVTFPASVAIGVANLSTNKGVIRLYPADSGFYHEPFVLALGRLLQHKHDPTVSWLINFYGPPGTIPYLEFPRSASDLTTICEYKHIFIGEGPPKETMAATAAEDLRDRHYTPLSRFGSGRSSGVEIQATLFSNFWNDHWIRTYSRPAEWMLIGLIGILCGSVFGWRGPIRTGIIAAGIAVTVTIFAYLAICYNLFFPFLVVPAQLFVLWTFSFIPVKTVFLSYRRSDGKHVALAIRDELQERGIDTYMDISSDEAGPLPKVLPRHVRRRANLLLVLTPNVLAGWNVKIDWIGEELKEALSCNKLILPVDVDNAGQLISWKLNTDTRPEVEPLRRVLSQNIRDKFDSERPEASIDSIIHKLRCGPRMN